MTTHRRGVRQLHLGSYELVGRPGPEHLCLVRKCPGCGRIAKLPPWRKCQRCEPSESVRKGLRP